MGPITVSRAVLALLASGVAAMPTLNRDLPTPEKVEAPGTPSSVPDNTTVEAPGILSKIAMNWPYGEQKVRGVNLGGVSYSIPPR